MLPKAYYISTISSRQLGIPLLAVLLWTGQARAVDITFNQVDWLDTKGPFAKEKSDWGAVTVQFSASDASLFTQAGNVLFGYLNIVTTVPGGHADNWAVRNYPVSFDNPGELDNSFPETLFFDLG